MKELLLIGGICILFGVLFPIGLAETSPPTNAPNVTEPVATTPQPTAPTSIISTTAVNPFVVGFGVIVLLFLFGASVYYVVIWPKNSLENYRKSFVEMVSRDTELGNSKEVKRAVAGLPSMLYGGARAELTLAGTKRLPTFREIETKRLEEEHRAQASLTLEGL